ncbi:MAG: hypothetical protein QOJ81_650 [Chloroflexota bacterium]|jgi:hypothetical protein|nr:hypothetical protein [Chloroflexota bacterium]
MLSGMKGDRVEAVVDTGQGTQTFEIVARRAGRRIEITNVRGVVEVSEVTRSGTPIRTGRFMANRLIALVEHPAVEGNGGGVEVETSRRMNADQAPRGRSRRTDAPSDGPRQLTVLGDDDNRDTDGDGGA